MAVDLLELCVTEYLSRQTHLVVNQAIACRMHHDAGLNISLKGDSFNAKSLMQLCQDANYAGQKSAKQTAKTIPSVLGGQCSCQLLQ